MIGKKRPLVIRKNNFLAIGPKVNQTEISPMAANNLTTLNSNTSGDRKFNNTNNMGGISGEASMSQTRQNITLLLKSLNSTQGNDTLGQTSLKDSKLIKIN